MKILLTLLSLILLTLPQLSNASASIAGPAELTVSSTIKGPQSFEDYQRERGAEEIHMVVGCGRQHDFLTTCGFEHNHKDAYTLNWGDPHGARFGVSDPHLAGNAFCEDTWATIPHQSVDALRIEHVPCFGDLNPAKVGQRLRAMEEDFVSAGHDLTEIQHLSFLTQAKIAEMHAPLQFLFHQGLRVLKPGGILAYYPAQEYSSHATPPTTILAAMTDYDPVFPRDPDEKKATLKEALFTHLPFNRGFSTLTILYYDLLRGRHGVVPLLKQEFQLDFMEDTYDQNLDMNTAVLNQILGLRSHNTSYVILKLTKAEGES